MQAINILRLFALHGYQVIFLLLLTGSFQSVQAQAGGKGNYNYFEFQQKPYYFGITLGLNNSSFTPFRSREFIFSDSIQAVSSIKGPGFNLGIVTNLKIGEYFDFRFLPTLSFGERKLLYDKSNRQSEPSQRTVESVFVEMPFHFRYKSAPLPRQAALCASRRQVQLRRSQRLTGPASRKLCEDISPRLCGGVRRGHPVLLPLLHLLAGAEVQPRHRQYADFQPQPGGKYRTGKSAEPHVYLQPAF